MIHFKATNEQLRQLAANAINASGPAGMGFLHYSPTVYKPDELPIRRVGNIHIDYFQGRMVKLNIWRTGDTQCRMNEKIKPDYQSWMDKYRSVPDLLRSAGIMEYDIKDEKE